MSGSVRLTMAVAGSACLVLALFPYYSDTAGPAARAGVPTVEVPRLGTLPLEPSKTVLRVGLPFSPLFVYLREITFESQPEITFESQPASASAAATGGEIEPGGAVSGGEVTINFTGEIGYTQNWHFGFFSWSLALALLGVGLLIIAFWNARSRSGARADVVS